jgi:acetyltransferase-like isoleucine patch superfamily enzyme
MPASASDRVEPGRYTRMEYLQFRGPRWLAIARAVAAVLTWPVVWPLAVLSRTSDVVFRSVSELLSLAPYAVGVVLRGQFYRFALRHCGRNVVIEFGSIFIHRDVSVGNHVIIGRYNIVHHCDIGDYVLSGEHVVFLSGSRQHSIDRTDVPMALQGGYKKRILIGDDCWIGAHAVVMEDVARGAIVGAGAVVTRPVGELMIVAGNPARPVRRRGAPAARMAPGRSP